MPRTIDLKEEYQTKQDAYLIWSYDVVGSEERFRHGYDYQRRDELAQVKCCRKQGHNRCGGVLAALDARDGVQVWNAHAGGQKSCGKRQITRNLLLS